MAKILIIEACVECKYLIDPPGRMSRCLAQKYLIIRDVYEIPSWCPLQDAPEQDYKREKI